VKEPVAVLGVGVEGRATVDYLLGHGVRRIAALDQRSVDDLPHGVETCFGPGYDQGLERFATVFRSPGIRPDRPGLLEATAAGTAVTSAVSLFLERCPAREVIGITGTVGKGTAASLTAAMLEADGRVVHLGGNIGTSPLAFVDEVREDHVVVLEISSFQALDISRSPHVGVILKTTSEHLDWHRDTDEYRAAKARLVAQQQTDDWVVVNADSPGAVEVSTASPARRLEFALNRAVDQGVYLDRDGLVLRFGDDEHRLPIDIRKLRLPGRFNLENVAAAVLAATAVGADPARVGPAAESFPGLPHRIEEVVEIQGIRFVNDSYATRPEAAVAALSAFTSEPLAVILGGSEKHAEFEALVAALAAHPGLCCVALIGETGPRLRRAIAAAGDVRFQVAAHDGLEAAVEAAAAAVSGGGVVLLSPACASFGLFPHYKARGERFRELALELARELEGSGSRT
jgi:UDP-N-acetylmuramoylalanine--D-glutamate ligase